MSEKQDIETDENPLKVFDLVSIKEKIDSSDLIMLKRLKKQTQMTVSQRLELSEKLFSHAMRSPVLKKFELDAYKKCDDVVKELEACTKSKFQYGIIFNRKLWVRDKDHEFSAR